MLEFAGPPTIHASGRIRSGAYSLFVQALQQKHTDQHQKSVAIRLACQRAHQPTGRSLTLAWQPPCSSSSSSSSSNSKSNNNYSNNMCFGSSSSNTATQEARHLQRSLRKPEPSTAFPISVFHTMANVDGNPLLDTPPLLSVCSPFHNAPSLSHQFTL